MGRSSALDPQVSWSYSHAAGEVSPCSGKKYTVQRILGIPWKKNRCDAPMDSGESFLAGEYSEGAEGLMSAGGSEEPGVFSFCCI